ncbi:MAG: hypothetical protein OXI59_12305 [Gemmatimonadota bacterium]|nr:hypothetical protein [Gemmatimonadota bacterium]MDE2724149.1 hypothetical protein [Gemmatimonadota bacterium]
MDKLLASNLSNETGGVIYSGDETLAKGKYLFFGLNPGGGKGHSIKEDFKRKHICLQNAEYNHILDSEWGSHAKGESPYQKRVQTLFEGLGHSPREVCVTNLIFVQSINEDLLKEKGDTWGVANAFWPFHESLIDIVDPDTIFVIHRKGFDYLGGKMTERIHNDWHPPWRCGSLIGEMNGRKRLIVYLPHFSGGRPPYAKGTHPVEKNSPEIFDWIKTREGSL